MSLLISHLIIPALGDTVCRLFSVFTVQTIRNVEVGSPLFHQDYIFHFISVKHFGQSTVFWSGYKVNPLSRRPITVTVEGW